MNQNRLKSPIVWITFFVLFFNQFAIYELIGIDELGFHTIVEAITTILIVFGILNNPTEKDRF